MILQKVFDKVRRITNTSTSTLTDARLLEIVNEAYLYIQRELAQNEIEVFGAIAKTDLVSGQSNYQLPDDLLAVLRIEINYDDPSDETRWVKMTESDLANLPYEWYSLINSQPKSKPLYDLFSNSIWTFPKAKEDSLLGLRLWYIYKLEDFTSTSDTLPKVIEKYWDVLANTASWIYFEEIGHPLAQRRFEISQTYLQRMISDLKIETIEPIKISIPNYYNSGWI